MLTADQAQPDLPVAVPDDLAKAGSDPLPVNHGRISLQSQTIYTRLSGMSRGGGSLNFSLTLRDQERCVYRDKLIASPTAARASLGVGHTLAPTIPGLAQGKADENRRRFTLKLTLQSASGKPVPRSLEDGPPCHPAQASPEAAARPGPARILPIR